MNHNLKNGDDNDNPLGKSTNDECGHEHYGNILNELAALKTKVQMLEEEREISLEKKVQESQAEFAEQKFRSLEKKYLKEMAELKVKNQQLTEENKAMKKQLEEMAQMKKIGEIENETIVLPHEMKVQLPLENWHDLLAFVPRPQLGNVASELGDCQFAHILQSFLYDEVREITLGEMSIIAPRSYIPGDQPMVRVGRWATTNMPDWPMPGNIKDFKEIAFKVVDTSVLHFLEKFRANSLLENVNLDVVLVDYSDYWSLDEDTLREVLTHILPLISSVHSIQMDYPNIELFNMVYNNNNNDNDSSNSNSSSSNTDHDYSPESQLLLKEMMAQTRILLIDWLHERDDNWVECSWKDILDWCCFWLYTPRDDGKPRMLKARNSVYDSSDCASFLERIEEDFKIANNPASFFIYIPIHRNNNVEDISFENVKTNEKLVLKKVDKKLLIARYPLDAAQSWIAANENEIYAWDNKKLGRKISMDAEVEIEI